MSDFKLLPALARQIVAGNPLALMVAQMLEGSVKASRHRREAEEQWAFLGRTVERYPFAEGMRDA